VPSETYLPRVQLFKDIVHVSSDLLDKVGKPFLAQLGVRDTVELKIVFDRLEELSWDIQVRCNSTSLPSAFPCH
jgi:hypothetical protein